MSSGNIIESYLVGLGFAVDQSSLSRFNGALKSAGNTVASTTGGIVGDFLKFQIAGTTAFAAVGFGAVAYIEKLAMTDQQQRLFAMRSFMTLQQARSVTMALNALDATLDDVAWDKELHQRFMVLIKDQRELAKMLGPSYEKQMHDIRDVWFQLQRLEVKGEYFGMKFVSDLLKKLGFGDGGILAQLERFNDYVMQNMPEWSDEITTNLVPAFHDLWNMLKEIGVVGKEVEVGFVHLIGALSGNGDLENSTGGIRDLSKALGITAHELGVILQILPQVAQMVPPLLEMIGHENLGMLKLLSGHPLDAKKEFDLARGGTDVLKKQAEGLQNWFASNPFAYNPGGSDASTGVVNGHRMTAHQWFLAHHQGGDGSTASNGSDAFERLVNAVGYIESGNRQNRRDGSIITSSAGALGRMQLMPKTAAGLGVNPYDEADNVRGGRMLLQMLLQKYGGNLDNTLAAYNWGEKKVDRALAAHRSFPTDVQAYARAVEGRAGITVGEINVVVPPGVGTPGQVAEIVRKGVRDGINDHVQNQGVQVGGAYN